MKKRRFIVLCSLTLCVCIVCAVCILSISSKAADSNYNDKYYSVTIPKSFSIEKMDDYDASIFLNDKYVGSISINPNCHYCSTLDSIVANWFGMKAYVKGTPVEENVGDYNLVKLTIAYEQSAAEVANGETPSSDEIHYIYTNYKNKLLDMSFDSSSVSEDDINSMVRSVTMK